MKNFSIRKLKVLLAVVLIITVSYFLYPIFNSKSAIIDKIYVINLDRSPSRYEQMKKKLDALELPVSYTRFSAVDGKKASLVNVMTKESITGEETSTNKKLLKGNFNIVCSSNYSGDFNPVKLNLVNFHPRTMGEVGCACSHKQIWQDIVDKGYDNILVLEDDVNFISDFKQRLENLMNNLPLDYDLIYFHALVGNSTFKIIRDNKLYQEILRFIDKIFESNFVKKARRNVFCTSGYIISQEGAKKLLDGSKSFLPIDHVINNLIEANKVKAYVTKPFLLNACLTTTDASECDSNIGVKMHNAGHSSDLIGR